MNGDQTLSNAELVRYMRQLVIQPFNSQGQERLKSARVLVVGAGGLGSPLIAYLAAAGVGHLTIIDDDEVSLSNLNRQILYRTVDTGAAKAELAAAFAHALNDEIEVAAQALRLDEDNVDLLVDAHDLVVDGSDNIDTRRLVAAATLRLGKVLVCGAVGQLEGHVSVFPPRGVGVPAGFDALYPRTVGAQSCEAVGVIGPVAGVIGSLMAVEAIKALCGMGQSLTGRVVHYDALAARFTDQLLSDRPAMKYLVGG